MATPEGSPVVHVVDDDDAFRRMVIDVLATAGIAAEPHPTAGAFLEADRADRADRAGCALIDVRLPDQSGLALLRRLMARDPRPSVIMASGYADVQTAVEALKLGALDFLEKPIRGQRLIDAVQDALRHDQAAREERAIGASIATRLASLSGREREVLEHVVAGEANKVIADDLGVSTKTVEFHRSRIMRKMDAQSVAELVRQYLTIRQA